MAIPKGTGPSKGAVSYTIGKAISLNDDSGQAFPTKALYDTILNYVIQKAEDYNEALLSGLEIRVYMSGMRDKAVLQSPAKKSSDEQIETQICQLMNAAAGEPQQAKEMDSSKRRYPKHIPPLRATSQKRRPFLVADLETVITDDIHVPYAAGFLVVQPGGEAL